MLEIMDQTPKHSVVKLKLIIRASVCIIEKYTKYKKPKLLVVPFTRNTFNFLSQT